MTQPDPRALIEEARRLAKRAYPGCDDDAILYFAGEAKDIIPRLCDALERAEGDLAEAVGLLRSVQEGGYEDGAIAAILSRHAPAQEAP
jgi:hypothetical protein